MSDTTDGSFYYLPLSCELCKSPYPTYLHQMDGPRTLIDVPKTKPPFIVLENTERDSQQQGTRGLHVISLAEKKMLKLGRGHEVDVRIADVSISRCHATIRFDHGQFLLEDNNSKFGTLVAMKKPRALEGSQISIQIGRTVLSMYTSAGNVPGQLPQASSSARDEQSGLLPLLSCDADHDDSDFSARDAAAAALPLLPCSQSQSEPLSD